MTGKEEGGDREGVKRRGDGEGRRGGKRTAKGWYVIAYPSMCTLVGRSAVCQRCMQ